MEVDRDFEFHTPQSNPIRRASDMFAADKNARRFRGEAGGAILASVSARLLGQMESIFGSLYSFSADAQMLPREWRALFARLYRRGLVASPVPYIDPPFNDEPPMTIVSMLPCLDNSALAGSTVDRVFSFGAGFDFGIACSKSIGEFLERYVLLHWKSYPTKTHTVDDLRRKGEMFLDPVCLEVLSKDQRLRESRCLPDETAPLRWVSGIRFSDGAETLLPAQSVFWNYVRPQDEPFIAESNTNGSGGMFTRAEAILSGFYELIQRDGFLVFWLNSIAPPRVDLETLTERAAGLVDMCQRYKFEVQVLDITTDLGIPAFVAVLMDGEGDGRAVFIGGGCELDPEAAICRAIEEALLVYHINRKFSKDFTLPEPYEPFRAHVGHRDRISLWARSDMFSRFEWFLKGDPVSFNNLRRFSTGDASQPEAVLALLAKHVKSFGPEYELYIYTPPHPILKEFGYHVAKVIVPAIVPLYLHEVNAVLGKSRLQDVPKKLGYQQARFPYPLPHPFP